MNDSFQGLRVAAFENRMAKKVGVAIEKLGGSPLVAPAMREVPLTENPEAFEFFRRLQAGEIDLMILMTGVGTRILIQTLETRYSKEEILTAFKKTKVCVRGPKPLATCKSLGLEITFTVPEPNTWHEILNLLDDEVHLAKLRVAVQEYGLPNRDFTTELKNRGADVFSFPVYKWALPEDSTALQNAIRAIAAHEVDCALFTSAHQVVNLLKMAETMNLEAGLRRGLHRVAIVSIGPTTSAALSLAQLFADHEVFPNKLDHLLNEAAAHGHEIIARKRARAEKAWVRIIAPAGPVPTNHTSSGREGATAKCVLGPPAVAIPFNAAGGASKPLGMAERKARLTKGLVGDRTRRTFDSSSVLRACRREPNDTVPIWLMRQAGRYMAEYQMVRRNLGFLELCKDSDLAAEVTISAVERLGVDAAIIFADILLIVEPMGLELDFEKGAGPRIFNPVRSQGDIQHLKRIDPTVSLQFVLEAIRKTRAAMQPHIPLIGFCGAPFTVAAYMTEGASPKNYLATKLLMHETPENWHGLLSILTDNLIDYLNAQIEAGAELIQIFDSWVGTLSPAEYQEYVLPHTQRLIAGIKSGVPVIHFGTGTASLLELQRQAGGDIIGVDWRVPLAEAWERLGDEVGVQGNLDPILLFAKPEIFKAAAEKILAAVGKKPGFIFNLGHGILPETPVDHVMELVDYVHAWRA